ncbi:murein L,D-transpeptidase catalytic domain family protein [Gillisia sp. Hel_I_29]|uniref:murein L,D-transpeptidase catalytic domain family protein n=1 Tax=Gillisia sp. Hel_I_29 TaxID=1249975 RepID=UPI000558D840|nr:murein L,D-transpeptidase catalytic domain family protein [Gillisia sp. Hel_I_29]
MTYKILTVFAALATSFAFTTLDGHNNTNVTIPTTTLETSPTAKSATLTFDEKVNVMYNEFVENNTSVPNLESFKYGVMGYSKLEDKALIKKEILTIIDFTLSSTQKRMWVLDMKNHTVLFNTLVAHGKNTGGEFASKFSNKVNSLQSSLGFYVTGETYYGKNGLSMFIDGQEEKFNSNARDRYVVVHGADYATKDFIDRAGRLGRSYGCPAVPAALTKDIIETIKDRSVMFIYSADNNYNSNSAMIKA